MGAHHQMGMRPWVALAMLGAAALVTLQVRANAELMSLLHNPAQIAVMNQGLQIAITTLIIVVSLGRRQAWRRAIAGLRSGSLRWWEILGGLGGAYVIAIQGIGAALIGLAAFSVALIMGQTVMGALVDRMGLGPGGRQQLTAMRLVASAVAIVAVVVTMWDRLSGTTDTGMLWVAIVAFTAGIVSAVQMALNARVAVFARQPLVSAWINFLMGSLAMLVVLLIVNFAGGWRITALPTEHLWLMFGPLCGLIFIVTAAWAVPVLGVLVMTLLSVAGQFLGAIVIDLVLPTAGVVLDPVLFVGLALALAAAAMGAFGRAQPRVRA